MAATLLCLKGHNGEGGREGGRRMKSNAADGFKRFITTAKAGKFRGSCVRKVSSRTMMVVVFGFEIGKRVRL